MNDMTKINSLSSSPRSGVGMIRRKCKDMLALFLLIIGIVLLSMTVPVLAAIPESKKAPSQDVSEPRGSRERRLSVGVGIVVPLSLGGFSSSVGLGYHAGLAYLRSVGKHFIFGGRYDYFDFRPRRVAAGSDQEAQILSLQGVGGLEFPFRERFQFHLSAGVGINQFQVDRSLPASNITCDLLSEDPDLCPPNVSFLSNSNTLTGRSFGLAWSAATGLLYEIRPHLLLGMEARYQHFFIDSDTFRIGQVNAWSPRLTVEWRFE